MKINTALGSALLILVILSFVSVISGWSNVCQIALVISTHLVVLIFTFRIGYRAGHKDPAAPGPLLCALNAASEAIHALEDPDGNMPAETGEFEDLKRVAWLVDRVIDEAMEKA